MLPELATTWEHSLDFKEWTFSLRKGVTFQDRWPFTARDVVRTFQRVLNPKLGSQACQLFLLSLYPDGITIADEHRVKFQCKVPLWNLAAMVSLPHTSIVSEDSPLDSYIAHPVGTGPFELAHYRAAVHLFATENQHYWRTGYPKLDAIHFFNVGDVTQRVAGMISGQFDLILTLTPVAIQSIRRDRRLVVASIESGDCMNFNMRAIAKAFDDNRVQQALKFVGSRAAQVKDLRLGGATEGSDQPISPASRIGGGIKPEPYDIARTQQLPAEAGYPNGIDVTVVTSTIDPGAAEQCDAYQQRAAPAGTRVKVQQVPTRGYYYNTDVGQYDFRVEPLAMHPDDTRFGLWYVPRGKQMAPTNWYLEEFRTLLRVARTAPEEKSRLARFTALEQYVSDHGPSINPVFVNVIGAHTKEVVNYAPNPMQYYRSYCQVELTKG
ncbi:MAG: ABC transporter substrate-binding protein [Acetobacteraceae bacterium]